VNHFRRKLKSNAVLFPSSDKKKQSTDHANVKNYLQVQRNKRIDDHKNRNFNGGYASQFSQYEEIKSDSIKSYKGSQANLSRPVVDVGLRKLLSD